MASIVSRVLLVVVGVVLLASVAIQHFFPGDDPYRCRAALETGRWIDPSDAHGNRPPFHFWEPDGCILHKYSSEDIRLCMQGRHMVFSGDSTSRQVAWGVARLLSRDEANKDADSLNPDLPFTATYHGVEIQRHQPAFVQIASPEDEAMMIKELELVRHESQHPLSIKKQNAPALVMLGNGRLFGEPNPIQIQQFGHAVTNMSELIGQQKDWWRAPMDYWDGVGNQVFFAPPLGRHPDALKKDPAQQQVDSMNKWLHEAEDHLNFRMLWSYQELVNGQPKTWDHPEGNSPNVIAAVAEAKANILLNLRCNAKLDRMRAANYGRTCCSDYGNKPAVQLGVVYAGLAYLVVCLVCEVLDLLAKRTAPRFKIFNMGTGAFILALLLSYYFDRTQMMGKGTRSSASYKDIAIYCAPWILATIVTIRKSKPPRPKPGALNVVLDQPFLGRDQTDEWKGWMQWIILVWHWTKAVNSPRMEIYALIRVIVSAYLFQTGYNHTTFFLVKKDFSFKRFAAVMLRLNLLTVALAFFMNMNYLFYYFAPLSSFWFIVVYATLAIARKYNNDLQMLLIKIAVAAALVALVFLETPIFPWSFRILGKIFNIQWNAGAANYRLDLDIFIVYFGMLLAVANLHTKEPLRQTMRYFLGFGGLLGLFGYWYFCTTFNTQGGIEKWTPYTSFIPILSFVAFRNMNTFFRNYSSRAMIWLGQCSLETYILQTHLYLAADYAGVLVIPGLQGEGVIMGRWKSLLLIVPFFLWICSQVAHATGQISNMILATTPPPPPPAAAPAIALREGGEKEEEDDESDDEPFLPEVNAGLLSRSRSTFDGYMKILASVKPFFNSLQVRMIILLVILWILNVLSPWPHPLGIPDGPHSIHSS